MQIETWNLCSNSTDVDTYNHSCQTMEYKEIIPENRRSYVDTIEDNLQKKKR